MQAVEAAKQRGPRRLTARKCADGGFSCGTACPTAAPTTCVSSVAPSRAVSRAVSRVASPRGVADAMDFATPNHNADTFHSFSPSFGKRSRGDAADPGAFGVEEPPSERSPKSRAVDAHAAASACAAQQQPPQQPQQQRDMATPPRGHAASSSDGANAGTTAGLGAAAQPAPRKNVKTLLVPFAAKAAALLQGGSVRTGNTEG